MSTLSSSQTSAQKEEVAIINISNLVVKFESGSGNNTIPLLLMESNFNCNVKDFYNNKRMTIIGNFNVEMAYYNAKLALWEHVIETRGLGYRYVICKDKLQLVLGDMYQYTICFKSYFHLFSPSIQALK